MELKKYYCITASGAEYFNAWVNTPIDIGTAKNPELSKIYFMGFAKKEIRIKLLEKHLADLKNMHSNFDKICNEGEILSNKMQNNDIFFYQLQTAKYGRDLIKFNIEWYTHLLKDLKE